MLHNAQVIVAHAGRNAIFDEAFVCLSQLHNVELYQGQSLWATINCHVECRTVERAITRSLGAPDIMFTRHTVRYLRLSTLPLAPNALVCRTRGWESNVKAELD